MKEKVIEHLQMVDKYHYALDSDIQRHAEAIDALYKADFDKRVAFEVACNPE